MNILKHLAKKANNIPRNRLLTSQNVKQFGVLANQSPTTGSK